MEIGWILLRTHFGVVITGSRSVRCRIISNDADPEPTTMPACSTTVSTRRCHQDFADGVARAQVPGQFARGVQAGQVDDAAHAGLLGGGGDVARRVLLFADEVASSVPIEWTR